MPLSPALAAWLRDQGHDAFHAAEIALHHAPDADIMARAEAADLDYPRLLALARSIEPSLILFRDGGWSDADVIARMSHVLSALTEEEIAQSIIVVEKDRIRRRRLPLDL